MLPLQADPEVRRLLAERYGITDMALLCADPWSIHALPEGKELRVIQCFLYMRSRYRWVGRGPGPEQGQGGGRGWVGVRTAAGLVGSIC